MAVQRNPEFQPGDQLGSYRIMRLLGHGGMGQVYEVEHVGMRKRYALKVLPRELARDPRFIDRFRVEARVMADLDHPNIVKVHYTGEETGTHFLVMDYVAGPEGEPRTLEDELAGGRRLPEARVREIALQLCDALGYAHGYGEGVVHRDLKPSNVLIDAEGRVKLSDFGLAKVLGGEYLRSLVEQSLSVSIARQTEGSIGDGPTEGRYAKTTTHSILGTYDYMSPEQKAGGEVTARSDIYALGVMLYRMLTGRKPEGAWEDPSSLGAARSWDGIVRGCMRSDPASRYGSVSELRSAIGRRPGVRSVVRSFGTVVAFAAVALAVYLLWPGQPLSPPRSEPPEPPLVLPPRPTSQPLVQGSGALRIAARTAEGYASVDLSGRAAEIRIGGGQWQPIRLGHVESGLECVDTAVALWVAGFEEPEPQTVAVADGRTNDVVFVLQPKPVRVRIEANVPDGEVFEAGTRHGRVGEVLELQPWMRHELSVQAQGWKPAAVVIDEHEPASDAGTKRVVLEKQPFPSDLVAVVGAAYVPLNGLASGSEEAQQSQRSFSEQTGFPLEVRTAKTGIVLRLVPPGTFTMGSPSTEDGRYADESPRREVDISSGLYVGKFEVTQGQWEAVMGGNPARFTGAGPDAPVDTVSWSDCWEFLRELCEREGVPAGTYRLLTEAEWEYACRAGTPGKYITGETDVDLGRAGWYFANSGGKMHPGGGKLPNGWGLHDMHGNLSEWCWDWYDPYPSAAQRDPAGPSLGSDRVVRGGGWVSSASHCRSAHRNWIEPGSRWNDLGFRVARQLTPSGR